MTKTLERESLEAATANYLANKGTVRLVRAKQRKDSHMDRLTVKQAYTHAVQWIAVETDKDVVDFNAIRESVTCQLVADTFRRPAQYVAADILAIRKGS